MSVPMFVCSGIKGVLYCVCCIVCVCVGGAGGVGGLLMAFSPHLGMLHSPQSDWSQTVLTGNPSMCVYV